MADGGLPPGPVLTLAVQRTKQFGTMTRRTRTSQHVRCIVHRNNMYSLKYYNYITIIRIMIHVRSEVS